MRLNLTEHGHQCGLIWMNIGNSPNTPHILNLKTVLLKYFYIVQRAIPIVDFVGDQPRIAFKFGGSWGALTHQDGHFLSLNTQSDLVMPLTGHLWPKLDCCTTSFPIRRPILDITGFLVKCGLIWLNIGNLHNTPHISRWKIVSWKVFIFCLKGDPNW